MDDLEGDLGRYALAEYGDFMVRDGDWQDAAEQHSGRSRTAQRVDAQRRAPVTTNYGIWAADPGHWDYPGIDTPRAAPMLLPKDLMTSAYRRTTINVRTTPAPGGEPPVDPLGKAEVAGIQDRGFAVRRGISAGTMMEDPFYDDYNIERRRRVSEMKEADPGRVPEAIREAEMLARHRDIEADRGILEARRRDDGSIYGRRPR